MVANDSDATVLERIEGELERLQVEALARLRPCTEAVHRDILRPGGKLLRPRLLFLCAVHGQALGGRVDWDCARRAALAIELAHVGTLYHDDIVDRSLTRRGVTATHARYGTRVAALGGAELLCLANQLAAGLPASLARMFGVAALRVSDGQLREIEWSGCFERTPAEYVRVATRKTASLFELAASIGGFAAEIPVAERDALARFGRHLGIAFQLFDDLDDFETSAEEHRPPANDLRERIYTLPVLFGCASGGVVGARLRELLREDGRPLGEAAANEICRLLKSSGAFEAAVSSAEAQRDLAAACLGELRPTSVRRMLTHLLESLRPRPHQVFPIAAGVAP